MIHFYSAVYSFEFIFDMHLLIRIFVCLWLCYVLVHCFHATHFKCKLCKCYHINKQQKTHTQNTIKIKKQKLKRNLKKKRTEKQKIIVKHVT